MKSKFIIIIISLLVIICLTGISFQFNNNHHSPFSGKGKVVLISEKSVNREMIDKIDPKYKSITITVLYPSKVDLYHFDNEDVVAVDKESLSYLETKEFIKDYIQENYILFVGNNAIENLSNELDLVFQNNQPIYSLNTGELISDELVEMQGSFSVFKYSENIDLKDGIETVFFNEDSLSIESYLIPCLDDLIDKNQYHFKPQGSNMSRHYLFNSDTKLPTSTYLYTAHDLYQDTNEIDDQKDYYLLKTKACFSKDGQYFTLLQHCSPDTKTTILERYPTHLDNATSYSSYPSDSVLVSYSGPKINVSSKFLEENSSMWTIDGQTFLNETGFDFENVFEFASLASVEQGSQLEWTYQVKALDQKSNETESNDIYIF
ncbi:hypothetical protein [Massilimicrobiota sp. SW1139]|uniref:hypothetical protein n=1 Tax=Massilimicrobiota sp. SW1139 TaxID=2530043 RepID=UPI00143ADCD6|nr:hypothetical protein [Massilimicrobiota sp. SW1139]NJE45547.1 hypothetical protein [Massilimicrobiota sp. SW1139]